MSIVLRETFLTNSCEITFLSCRYPLLLALLYFLFFNRTCICCFISSILPLPLPHPTEIKCVVLFDFCVWNKVCIRGESQWIFDWVNWKEKYQTVRGNLKSERCTSKLSLGRLSDVDEGLYVCGPDRKLVCKSSN